jgi:hypothetical protein
MTTYTYPDRVKFTTATTGTGSVTVGSAFVGFRTPATAGLGTTTTTQYVIEDNGGAWEIGTATWNSGATVMTRSVNLSSNSNALISLSGSALVYMVVEGSSIASFLVSGGVGALARAVLGGVTDDGSSPLQTAAPVVITDATTNMQSLTINGSGNSNGGAIEIIGNGATTPKKWLRVSSGLLEVINSAYSAVIVIIDDSGDVTFTGATTTTDLILPNSSASLVGAWTAFTPTVTSLTGTLTTVSAVGQYKQIGKSVFININITITTNGTGATLIKCTLPFTTEINTCNISGSEIAVTGKSIKGTAYGTDNFMYITNYDNSYPGADGAVLNLTGVYQTA